ncbi:MAG: hypothetical protein AAFR46_11670 [Pseudomonadota bacterium]
MTARAQAARPARRRFCLTELSATLLVGCAVALSAGLWIAILAVL